VIPNTQLDMVLDMRTIDDCKEIAGVSQRLLASTFSSVGDPFSLRAWDVVPVLIVVVSRFQGAKVPEPIAFVNNFSEYLQIAESGARSAKSVQQ
jgi:hypothetical protein